MFTPKLVKKYKLPSCSLHKRYCHSFINPSNWNSPRDNLDKARWVTNMIDAMIPNISIYSQDIVDKRYIDKLQENFNVNNDGHSGNTFYWTFKQASYYCQQITNGLNPTYDGAKNQVQIIKEIVEEMKLDKDLWLQKKITHIYDSDFNLLTQKISSLSKLDQPLKDYYYYNAINILHKEIQ